MKKPSVRKDTTIYIVEIQRILQDQKEDCRFAWAHMAKQLQSIKLSDSLRMDDFQQEIIGDKNAQHRLFNIRNA